MQYKGTKILQVSDVDEYFSSAVLLGLALIYRELRRADAASNNEH